MGLKWVRTSSGATKVVDEFLATDARFFGEAGVPNDQAGWVDIATAPATITLDTQLVFKETKDVVKHFDDGAQSTNSQFALSAQNWIDINDFGASYGGVSRLDTVDGANGFFTGLQANAAENPLATGNRRYGIAFADDGGGFLRATPPGAAAVVMDGTLGNPKVLFDEWFKWEVVVPAGLGASELFINDILTTLAPAFDVNAGGLGTHATVASGSSGGVDRVAYHSDFGVTIYEDAATKTFSVAAMQSNIAQILIPPGRRDYIITVPDGSPRKVGDVLSFTRRNVGGTVTLKAENTAAPQALFGGLNEVTRTILDAGDVTLVNTLENGNAYDAGIPPVQPDKVTPVFVATADVTVANTVTETSIIGIGNGQLVVPGNTSKIGDLFYFSAQGRFSASANPTLKLKLLLAGAVLADTGAVVISNGTDIHWFITGEAVVRSLGVTGTIMVSGGFITSAGDHFKFVNTVPITIDTTVNKLADISAQWGTAAAGNTITCQIASLTKILSP